MSWRICSTRTWANAAVGLRKDWPVITRTCGARAGDLTAQEAWRKLLAGFARGRAVAPGEQLANIERGWSNTMRVYWSGAAYWFESDLAMRAVGSSLDEVLQRYRRAGIALEQRVEPADFVAALDAI